MNSDRNRYQAFLLRMWVMDNSGRPAWRFSLQDTHGGPPVRFESWVDLQAHLTALMAQAGRGAGARVEKPGKG